MPEDRTGQNPIQIIFDIANGKLELKNISGHTDVSLVVDGQVITPDLGAPVEPDLPEDFDPEGFERKYKDLFRKPFGTPGTPVGEYTLSSIDQRWQALRHMEFAISRAAGDFAGALLRCAATQQGKADIIVKGDEVEPADRARDFEFGDVTSLEDGKVYFLNVRSNDLPGSWISVRFSHIAGAHYSFGRQDAGARRILRSDFHG